MRKRVNVKGSLKKDDVKMKGRRKQESKGAGKQGSKEIRKQEISSKEAMLYPSQVFVKSAHLLLLFVQ
jgi:hypothetical protein